jgi:2-amino-4-hydroxy-6-hydroxymethyldihydropteridine diphosphokinase
VVRVFIGIGANLDDPEVQVRTALRELDGVPGTRLAAGSSLYRNPPMGPPDQPDYVNAVAMLETALEPEPLLDALLAIEAAHGRERGRRWGERVLDLDLLLYGDRRVDTPRLTVPHPGIAERRFVLEPLAELDPQLRVPGLGSVGELLAACPATPMERLP